MHSTCKCGGRIRPKDPSVAQPATTTYPHVTYRTERITQGVATFYCDQCGRVFTQRLRQAKRTQP